MKSKPKVGQKLLIIVPQKNADPAREFMEVMKVGNKYFYTSPHKDHWYQRKFLISNWVQQGWCCLESPRAYENEQDYIAELESKKLWREIYDFVETNSCSTSPFSLEKTKEIYDLMGIK